MMDFLEFVHDILTMLDRRLNSFLKFFRITLCAGI